MVVEEGGSNVFADIGLPDAAERLAKADLAIALRRVVRARGWTQVQAARALRIPASDMSDLMRGKLARFGRERLEDFLVRLGIDVQIRLAPSNGKTAARISVEVDGVL